MEGAKAMTNLTRNLKGQMECLENWDMGHADILDKIANKLLSLEGRREKLEDARRVVNIRTSIS